MNALDLDVEFNSRSKCSSHALSQRSENIKFEQHLAQHYIVDDSYKWFH